MDVDFVINLIAVGAPSVGKSTLIKRYLTQQFNEEYQPTGLEQLTMSIRVGTATAKMQIWDFGGRIALDSDIGRKLLDRGDIFLLCFNVAEPSTFEIVKQVLDIVSPQRASAFVCLVGCKSDLRADLLAAAAPQNGEDKPDAEVNEKNGDTETPANSENNSNESDFPVTPRTSPDAPRTSPDAPETPANVTESPESTNSDTPKQEASPPPNLGVSREQATELATLNDVLYFEVSAKANTDVQVVFHTALIHAYKKYLAKKKTPQEEELEIKEREKDTAELRGIFTSDTPTFFGEFFPRERMRSIFIELFKSRDDDLIKYLAHKDILPQYLDAALLDFTMPSSVDNRICREFAVTSFDNFYRLDSIFVATAQTPEILDSLFALFFDRPKFRDIPLPRKRYLIRFFTQLFDTQTEHIIKYAQSNAAIITRLVEHVESDDVKEVLSVLLASEKKHADRSGSEFVLLENSKLEPYLISQIQQNGIGVVDSFFRIITSVRGFSSPIVCSFLKYENFNVVKSTLDLISNTSYAFDAVTFFCDVILRVVSLNESLVHDFVNVVSTNMTATKNIISAFSSAPSSPPPSSSLSSLPTQNCQLHAALLLVDGLVRRGIGTQELVKPLLLDCLNTFFRVKFGNVIHCIAGGILVSFFEQQYNEEIDILVNDGHIIEKILELSESDKSQSAGIYGHLMVLAKAMNSCPHLEEILLGNEKWQQFMESSVKGFLNKSICPPDASLLAAKQRQIQRAGGSFLG